MKLNKVFRALPFALTFFSLVNGASHPSVHPENVAAVRTGAADSLSLIMACIIKPVIRR
jgi:hypothetical protein